MSLGCAGCGDCCNPVKISDETLAVAQWWATSPTVGPIHPNLDTESLSHIAEHLTEISRVDGQVNLACDRYDPESRACTAYEDRPPMCSSFPFYGRPAQYMWVSEERCSYWLDVEPRHRPDDVRPLIPITVVSHA